MISAFGKAWSHQYFHEDLPKLLPYFPRGINKLAVKSGSPDITGEQSELNVKKTFYVNTQQQEQVLQTFKALASGLSREAKGERLHLLLVAPLLRYAARWGTSNNVAGSGVRGSKQTNKLFSSVNVQSK